MLFSQPFQLHSPDIHPQYKDLHMRMMNICGTNQNYQPNHRIFQH